MIELKTTKNEEVEVWSSASYSRPMPPFPWKTVAVGVTLLGFGLFSLISLTNRQIDAEFAEKRAYWSQCEYQGSHVVGTGGVFGGTSTVHTYLCDGRTEETYRKW